MEISTEDYLKAIFNLETVRGTEVKPQAISDKLQITPASVSEMMRKLSDKKLVNYAPYKGVSLTQKGRSIGQNMVRRHRILEMYLHQVLGYTWDKVHEEADRLEHAASDTLIQKMEFALHFPKFDPHGDPIPSIDGQIPKQEGILLSDAKKNKYYQISRVSDFDTQFLAYLEALGLRLHTVIHIKEILSFDQSLIINVGGLTHHVSYVTGQHVWLIQVDSQHQEENQ